jgi:hypothetical protein
MTIVFVNPGICGFDTVIKATRSGDIVKLKIRSECKEIQKLANALTSFSMQDIRNARSFTENKVYENAARHIRHFSCPIPCAIFKAIEVELGLALKKIVTIKFVDEISGN